MQKYKNPFNYTIDEDTEALTTLITNQADTVSIIVDTANVQTVLDHFWQSNRNGYYTITRNEKLYLANLLLKLERDEVACFKDNNTLTDYTWQNIYSNKIIGDNVTRLDVEGFEVLVDNESYYTHQLYKYKFTIYQGYVVTLVKRRRVFLHKLAFGLENEPDVKCRFRTKDKLDCRASNIFMETVTQIKLNK
jgi:hypothetical protein